MECLKNHALALGGHALDGCGEFMPAGADGTLDALNCAACNCHRNFHRKETVAGDAFLSTRDDHEDGSEPSGGGGVGSASKKRFRTKFSPEQKEKMTVFAESVGWKLQKHDEVAVQGFCDEVGVKRNVLKVWMHNHKNTLAIKKP
ncbi:hypothetical protein Ahy_B03g062837 isoform C [Arachis hypogaea]|uniref:ZF-HD dimerization-type domain-containing protein n=1 Tax=Arachis hypogaea TaxID=3818 RepID=A0A444ZVN3_ARAHY|nr:hypothetical protein Ahy_B03g062837 isoform C [Arachis hypogaea]